MCAEFYRYYSDCDYCKLQLPSRSEHWLSVRSGGGGGSLFQTMKRKLMDLEGSAVSQFVMAGCQHYVPGMEAMGQVDWPVTWIQGDACRTGQVYASQINSISDTETKPVLLDGEVVGYEYEDDYARFCRLSGLKPQDSSASRRAQARSVFERMAAGLKEAGMKFTDTVRTWLYLDQLLDWYDVFNEVRTDYFTEQDMFEEIVPASTGIGAANPWGLAVLADLVAVAPKNDGCKIKAVSSPMQCPAPDYKSSFSRALELSFPTHRQLLISGTASIDKEGNTVHIDDAGAQIDLTMRVIKEILAECDMDWSNLARGIAYFKNRDDVQLWDNWCKEHELPRFSMAVSHADVCRHDLLFELEVDAIKVP